MSTSLMCPPTRSCRCSRGHHPDERQTNGKRRPGWRQASGWPSDLDGGGQAGRSVGVGPGPGQVEELGGRLAVAVGAPGPAHHAPRRGPPTPTRARCRRCRRAGEPPRGGRWPRRRRRRGGRAARGSGRPGPSTATTEVSVTTWPCDGSEGVVERRHVRTVAARGRSPPRRPAPRACRGPSRAGASPSSREERLDRAGGHRRGRRSRAGPRRGSARCRRRARRRPGGAPAPSGRVRRPRARRTAAARTAPRAPTPPLAARQPVVQRSRWWPRCRPPCRWRRRAPCPPRRAAARWPAGGPSIARGEVLGLRGSARVEAAAAQPGGLRGDVAVRHQARLAERLGVGARAGARRARTPPGSSPRASACRRRV